MLWSGTNIVATKCYESLLYNSMHLAAVAATADTYRMVKITEGY